MSASKSVKVISSHVGLWHLGALKLVPGVTADLNENIVAEYKGHKVVDAMVAEGQLKLASGSKVFSTLQELFDAGAAEPVAHPEAASDADEPVGDSELSSSQRPTPKTGFFKRK